MVRELPVWQNARKWKLPKKKTEEAQAALREYVERSPEEDADPVLHRRLSEELRTAQSEFLETMK